MQRKARLALESDYPRAGGVARAPAPETHGALGPLAAPSHMRKQFSHLFNTGSHATNPAAPDGSTARWPPPERTGIVSAEADFLHPCVCGAAH